MKKLKMSHKEEKLGCQVLLPDVKLKRHIGDEHLLMENNIGSQELHRISSRRSMKKGLRNCMSHVGAHGGACRKMRTIDKGGRCQRLVIQHPPTFLEKVDAVASPRKMMGEKYMHASFKNRVTGFSKMHIQVGKSIADNRFNTPRSIEPNDMESDACSIATCGSTNGPYILPHQSVKNPCENSDSHFDDAESSSGWEYGNKRSYPSKDNFATEIHELELHAYRSTMVALHASGPLSWEQEAMITNLRLMLHISNDEHLLELRHLVSVETALPIS